MTLSTPFVVSQRALVMPFVVSPSNHPAVRRNQRLPAGYPSARRDRSTPGVDAERPHPFDQLRAAPNPVPKGEGTRERGVQRGAAPLPGGPGGVPPFEKVHVGGRVGIPRLPEGRAARPSGPTPWADTWVRPYGGCGREHPRLQRRRD